MVLPFLTNYFNEQNVFLYFAKVMKERVYRSVEVVRGTRFFTAYSKWRILQLNLLRFYAFRIHFSYHVIHWCYA